MAKSSKRSRSSRSRSTKRKVQKMWMQQQVPRAPAMRTTTLGGDKKLVKLKYSDQFQLSVGAAGLPVGYVMSLNGLYDPNITGVGHQPRGFDQYMAMFGRYCVIGAKIRAIAINVDDNNAHIVGFVTRFSSSFGAPSLYDLIENGQACYGAVNNSDGGPAILDMERWVDVGKHLCTPHPLSERDIQGNASANPAKQLYVHFFASPLNGEDTNIVRFNVEIEYSVILNENLLPSAS